MLLHFWCNWVVEIFLPFAFLRVLAPPALSFPRSRPTFQPSFIVYSCGYLAPNCVLLSSLIPSFGGKEVRGNSTDAQSCVPVKFLSLTGSFCAKRRLLPPQCPRGTHTGRTSHVMRQGEMSFARVSLFLGYTGMMVPDRYAGG